MKKYIWLIISVLLIFSGSIASAKFNPDGKYFSINAKPVTNHPKILFIGNSHTSRNNMPRMFKKMCISAGINAKVTEVTHEGYSISQYVYPRTDEEKGYHDRLFDILKNNTWDYIILQGKLMETENNL